MLSTELATSSAGNEVQVYGKGGEGWAVEQVLEEVSAGLWGRRGSESSEARITPRERRRPWSREGLRGRPRMCRAKREGAAVDGFCQSVQSQARIICARSSFRAVEMEDQDSSLGLQFLVMTALDSSGFDARPSRTGERENHCASFRRSGNRKDSTDVCRTAVLSTDNMTSDVAT